MYDPVEERIELPGRSLSLLRWGKRTAVPTLCLHGWLDNANSFAPLAPHLGDLQLMALELPGHGRSQHRDGGAAYHQLDWVVDVVEVADRLELFHFNLVGHSMGAGIASLVAGTVPERVRRLVLLDGMAPRPVAPAQLPEQLADCLAARRRHRATPQIRRGSSFATAVRARIAYAEPLSEASAELLCRRALVAAPRGVVFGNDRRLQHAQPRVLSEEAIHSFLNRIACPTMLIEGREGLGRRAGITEARKQAVRDLVAIEVPGGHHVHMDAPELVATHLRSFLASP